MDGKVRHTDNASVERLWRALRYEEVFLKAHVNVTECTEGSGSLLQVLQLPGPYQSLGYRTWPRVFYEAGITNCRARLTIHICRSSRNSDTGVTPQTNRWSRARVQAT